MRPPLLVLAAGNPARGDDGAGPWLAARLGGPGVEVIEDFQFQVEHALDLEGRAAVLFIDAAEPGAAGGGLRLAPLQPAQALPALSHALTPAGVLHVAQRLGRPVPPAWQLAVEGQAFGLGEGLGPAMLARLPAALALARGWLAGRRGARA
jgi:hydrogenase maturation protease